MRKCNCGHKMIIETKVFYDYSDLEYYKCEKCGAEDYD